MGIRQDPQDHALLPVLNVDHSELALHSLHVFGFDHGLPDLAFDLAGQLVVWSTVLSGFVIFFASFILKAIGIF